MNLSTINEVLKKNMCIIYFLSYTFICFSRLSFHMYVVVWQCPCCSSMAMSMLLVLGVGPLLCMAMTNVMMHQHDPMIFHILLQLRHLHNGCFWYLIWWRPLSTESMRCCACIYPKQIFKAMNSLNDLNF